MTIEERLARLEAETRRARDELDLIRLTLSYGPAVDSLSHDPLVDLWTPDATYDVPGLGKWTGHAAIRAMIDGELHRGLVEGGCAHVLTTPRLVIDGDRATGTCYSHLFQKREDGFGIWRVSANRWEYVRTPQGWRIAYRTILPMDGSDEPRALLAAGFADPGQS